MKHGIPNRLERDTCIYYERYPTMLCHHQDSLIAFVRPPAHTAERVKCDYDTRKTTCRPCQRGACHCPKKQTSRCISIPCAFSLPAGSRLASHLNEPYRSVKLPSSVSFGTDAEELATPPSLHRPASSPDVPPTIWFLLPGMKGYP
jgi:hypothetical protein